MVRTDGELLRGDATDWGEIFLRHQGAIYNFCLRRVGQERVAEALTAAVFIAGWQRRADVSVPNETLLPWLYGVATMLTRNYRRALRRYGDALERMVPAAADQVAPRRTALRRFRQRDVDILDLADTQKLAISEIALILSIRAEKVKSRLLRARKRLVRNGSDPASPLIDLAIPADRVRVLHEALVREIGDQAASSTVDDR